MRTITATHVKYYHVCHRKLWLFDRDLWMEHTSEAVQGGELLHQRAYPQRAERYREISLAGSKIDFYDPHRRVIHEIKSSEKLEHSHIAQLKYYLWLLANAGIEGATGVLEYPKQRQTLTVALADEDQTAIEQWLNGIRQLQTETIPCPPVINKPFCRQCSYYEFCYVGE